jgi:hypothetical protein
MKPGRLSDELSGIQLGDPRRNRRLVKVAQAMAESPQLSLSAACGGWNETMGAYRVLGSAGVSVEKILAPHRRALLERAEAMPSRAVAVIQDTTELDFTRMKHMEGCGPLNDESRRGVLMHSLYAVSEEGLPLGVWDTAFLTRSDEDFRGAAERKRLPIEQKESYRWLEGYRKTQELAAALPHCEVFSLSDREGDIYEVFAAWAQRCAAGGPAAQWIIRANQDRALSGMAEGVPDKLFAALSGAPLFGEISFEMPAKTQMKKVRGKRVSVSRSARTVVQEVRAMALTPRPPDRKGGRLPPVTIWAVWAKEINPPEGEEPVCWLLLTGCEVTSLAQARRIIALYLRRWDIEVFHRVLKTGCRVEQMQLKGAQAVRHALSLYAIIAWRILYLTHLGRICPEMPCSAVFMEAEWKAACAVAQRGQPPRRGPPEPTLGEFILIVGRLGGHLGRKSDGPPGAQVLWRGLARLRDFACAWQALESR